MSKILQFSFVALFVLLINNSFSQHNHEQCGSDAVHQKMLTNDLQYRAKFQDFQSEVNYKIATGKTANRATSTIPVVFHVMHLGEEIGTGSNISDE